MESCCWFRSRKVTENIIIPPAGAEKMSRVRTFPSPWPVRRGCDCGFAVAFLSGGAWCFVPAAVFCRWMRLFYGPVSALWACGACPLGFEAVLVACGARPLGFEAVLVTCGACPLGFEAANDRRGGRSLGVRHPHVFIGEISVGRYHLMRHGMSCSCCCKCDMNCFYS